MCEYMFVTLSRRNFWDNFDDIFKYYSIFIKIDNRLLFVTNYNLNCVKKGKKVGIKHSYRFLNNMTRFFLNKN